MYHKPLDIKTIEVKGHRVFFSELSGMHLKLKVGSLVYKIHWNKNLSLGFSCHLNLKRGGCIWLLNLISVEHALHLFTCQAVFLRLTECVLLNVVEGLFCSLLIHWLLGVLFCSSTNPVILGVPPSPDNKKARMLNTANWGQRYCICYEVFQSLSAL